MVDLKTERNGDGFYTLDIEKTGKDGTTIVNAVISTASRLTYLTCEDVAKMLRKKPETVYKFIRDHKSVIVDRMMCTPCYMDNVKINGKSIERLYFIIHSGQSTQSCIGLDIFANAEVKTKHARMELEYVNEAYYRSDFMKNFGELEPYDIENTIGDDRTMKSLDVLFDRASGNK